MRNFKPKFKAHARRQSSGAGDNRDDGQVLIWGSHAVEAALNNLERTITRLLATDNAIARLDKIIAARGIRPERTTPKDLDRRLGAETVHQGVLLETEPLPNADLEDLAATAIDRGPLLVLDQVTDPHNVGAILRSAAVFGSAGLVMTQRHSPPLTGVLAKSASGALELVPVALVPNLSQALAQLNDAGVVTIGLAGDAAEQLEDVMLAAAPVKRRGPDAYALVLGAEGKGLRQLTSQTCSRICRIATTQTLASLNVSNAAAVALHLAAMGRRQLAR